MRPITLTAIGYKTVASLTIAGGTIRFMLSLWGIDSNVAYYTMQPIG